MAGDNAKFVRTFFFVLTSLAVRFYLFDRLKFPMLRPSGIRLYARTKRLMAENRIKHSEEKLRKEQFRLTRDPKFATLIGHIGETFTVKKEEEMESNDAFSVSTNNITTGFEMHMNPNHKDLIASKWCYDTPGTINPKQV